MRVIGLMANQGRHRENWFEKNKQMKNGKKNT